jgi:site-specific recombinase XerD
MTAAPVVTIYVRHAKGCKYAGDDFARRCKCRKHLRWIVNGKRYRKQAGTRSWEEAEHLKHSLEDQLSGRTVDSSTDAKSLADAIDVFLTDKRVQGLSASGMGKYTRELERLRTFCEQRSLFTVQGITRDLLTEFAGTWEALYPSSFTRSKLRERYKTFLKYCYQAQWLPRIPQLPKIKVDVPPTMPLTEKEYERLLNNVSVLHDPTSRIRCRGLFQLMRWSGLALGDALTLRRNQLTCANDVYRVTTSRQKTGTDVSVPLPPEVAKEILAVPNALSTDYLFWSGQSTRESLTTRWTVRYIRPVFEAAELYDSDGNSVSHRLRDTFAVDLLTKGVPLPEVSKLLGHTSIKTTEKHYSPWVKGRQDRLDTLVIGTWQKTKKAK